MALQVALDAVDSMVGSSFPEAYVKLEFSRVYKDATYLFVNWYADAQARVDNKQPVRQKEFTAQTTDLIGDFYPAAYTWLKTQPEFAGAIDV